MDHLEINPMALPQISVFLCGLVVRVPAYRSGSIPGATRFSEK
jgi:hypothetical protein